MAVLSTGVQNGIAILPQRRVCFDFQFFSQVTSLVHLVELDQVDQLIVLLKWLVFEATLVDVVLK